MTTPRSETAETPLIFNWDAPSSRQLTILAFIAASLVLHALCFYLFQIVYRPAIVLLPPPARVNLITSSSEEGRTLLRWIEAEDPALASATLRPPEARGRALPKLQHVPSYLSEEPQLREPPPLVVDLRPPSPQPPGPVPMQHRQVRPKATAVTTAIAFSEELRDFGAAEFPATKFSAATNEQPESIRFRIAVGRRGEVRYCFPVNSSGDAALDEQARKYLALTRFAPGSPARDQTDQALIWGIATIEWGNDVAHPPATSTSAP
jgi:outer membrane biosynthesis protein TonB